MSNNNATASANAGFSVFSLATVVLLVFKLAGMAGASWGLPNLSWFWVFFPLGLGIAIGLFILLILVLIIVVID